jgi:N-hydroxyarylamine O-acetyltransferase
MDLQAYLDRIGFVGEARTDVDTLRAVHHRHLTSITYENLSVQLGEPVGIDPAAAYAKIVGGRRGGWCYEMNGLLGWALEEIGFDVMRMAAGVLRSVRGDWIIGNHLALAVQLEDGPWLADVGFGDGLREAVPLREGPIEQFGLSYRLELLDDEHWRLHNHEHGGAADFDFRHERAEEARLGELCTWLQTAEESGFVQTLICQRFTPDAIEVLRGRVRRTITPDGTREWVLNDADELQREVQETFELDVDIGHLWSRVAERHEELFGEGPRPGATSD